MLIKCTYIVLAGPEDKPMVEVETNKGKKVLAPEEVSAMVSYRPDLY